MTRVALATALLALATAVWPRPSEWADRRSWIGVIRPVDELADGSRPTGDAPARWWRRPLRRTRRSGRDTDRRTTEVLALLDALAPALRAGLSPAAALEAVASPSVDQRSPLLVALLHAADRADHLAPVWRAEADEMSSGDLALVAAAWALCERLGSPLAPTVATVSRVVRQRRAVRQRTAAALAGPRTSMTVLTALPAAGPVLSLALGLSPVDLYASPAGAAALVAGVLLLGVGRWWGARLVASIGDADPAADAG